MRSPCPLGALCDRLRPGQKAFLKTLGMQAGQDAAKRIVGGNSRRQGEKGLEPSALTLTKKRPILESFPARQERAQGNDQDIEEVVLPRPLNSWFVSGAEMLDNRRVHSISHGGGSSAQGSWWEQQSRGYATGVEVSLVRCAHPGESVHLSLRCGLVEWGCTR
jgi:hypothetical protein